MEDVQIPRDVRALGSLLPAGEGADEGGSGTPKSSEGRGVPVRLTVLADDYVDLVDRCFAAMNQIRTFLQTHGWATNQSPRCHRRVTTRLGGFAVPLSYCFPIDTSDRRAKLADRRRLPVARRVSTFAETGAWKILSDVELPP